MQTAATDQVCEDETPFLLLCKQSLSNESIILWDCKQTATINPMLGLLDKLLVIIFSAFPIKDVLNLRLVCKELNAVVSSDNVWKILV